MNNNSIKILDCTLRDGGYMNDWTFGSENIQSIISSLSESKIDFIECGFLKSTTLNKDQSFFSTIKDLEPFIRKDQKVTLMINYGEYPIKKFSKCDTPNIYIRVAFKKNSQTEALDYIKTLVNLGWSVFANPMSTNTYSKEELKKLIEGINKIKPYGITIVDTLGNMYEKEVSEIFEYIDSILEKNIAICFHSHNSMQLSFSNTKALLKLDFSRELIIDSCLYGMGRGAGNLCTELITKYLNDNYKKSYKISPLLKTIECYLKPFFEKTPWGYSTPYYIAAIHGCHPNYASQLVNRNFSDEEIDRLLTQIPKEKRSLFDENFFGD